MADKKIVDEAYIKSATENPKSNTRISALDVKTNEHGLELIAGKDAIEKLMELGAEVSPEGKVSIKTGNNEVIREGATIKRRETGNRGAGQEHSDNEK